MMRLLRVEVRKMRRLRTLPILAGMVLAVVALSCVALLPGGAREGLERPEARPWAVLLMNYTMMAAMTSPILVAVLASRQTDPEHAANGWGLAAGAGVAPGSLCLAKLAVLSLLLALAVPVQSALVATAGFAIGVRVPFDPAPWIGYTILLLLVDLAFLALHLWLAARIENQLLGTGIGMLGAFLAVFSLLTPPVFSLLLPWGAYAAISRVAQRGGELVFIEPALPRVAGFLLLAAAAFALAVRRFDRLER